MVSTKQLHIEVKDWQSSSGRRPADSNLLPHLTWSRMSHCLILQSAILKVGTENVDYWKRSFPHTLVDGGQQGRPTVPCSWSSWRHLGPCCQAWTWPRAALLCLTIPPSPIERTAGCLDPCKQCLYGCCLLPSSASLSNLSRSQFGELLFLSFTSMISTKVILGEHCC